MPMAGPAHAQPDRPAPASSSGPKPLSQSLVGAAKADYEAAMALYANADFAGARARFTAAYDRAGDPRLLWNMAVSEKQLGRYHRVVTLVSQYLRDGAGKMRPDEERVATELLDAVKARVSALWLTVNEAGAVVYVDDERIGATPLASPVPLDVGARVIRVSKPGFLDVTQTLQIAGSAEIPLSVTLLAAQGRLVVVAGDGDTLALDGAVVAGGRYDGSVAAGAHGVRVTADGRKPYEAEVAIAANATRTLNVSLAREPSRGVWPWAVGGAALAVGAGVAGYFLLRPKDEEPRPGGALAPGVVQMPLRGGF
jgi:hypothetical protein